MPNYVKTYMPSDDCAEVDAKNVHNIRVLGIEQRGAVVAERSMLDLLPKAAFKVKSWQGGRAMATFAKVRAICEAHGFGWECQFDAAHGRR